MPLSIRDEKTTALVRQLAARKGVSLTEAVRQATESELARLNAVAPRPTPEEKLQRIRAIQERVAKYQSSGKVADKAFYDSLSDDS